MAAIMKGGVLLASGARTAETTSETQNGCGKGVIVIVKVTVKAAAGSLTPSIQGKDPASGDFYDLLTATAISATGTYTYYVGTGGGANSAMTKSAAVALPAPWRVKVAVSNADSWTYSVGFQFVE